MLIRIKINMQMKRIKLERVLIIIKSMKVNKTRQNQGRSMEISKIRLRTTNGQLTLRFQKALIRLFRLRSEQNSLKSTRSSTWNCKWNLFKAKCWQSIASSKKLTIAKGKTLRPPKTILPVRPTFLAPFSNPQPALLAKTQPSGSQIDRLSQSSNLRPISIRIRITWAH